MEKAELWRQGKDQGFEGEGCAGGHRAFSGSEPVLNDHVVVDTGHYPLVKTHRTGKHRERAWT